MLHVLEITFRKKSDRSSQIVTKNYADLSSASVFNS